MDGGVGRAELSRVDLNLLSTFCCVVEQGGVTAAARALGRTQPSITARLKQLEAELGAPLFERVGRKLALTVVGRAVEREASELLRGASALLDTVRKGQAQPMGTLRLGALPTLSAHLLAFPVAELALEFPGVDVEIRTGFTVPLLEALRQGEIDVVLTVGAIASAPGLDVAVIGHVLPVVALPAAARSPRRALTVADLKAQDLVVFSRGLMGDPFFDAVWTFLERHELVRRIRVSVPHIQSIKGLVSAGTGVSILPDYTVVEPDLCTRPIQGLRTSIPISAATRKSSTDVPAVAELMTRVRARIARRGRPSAR